LLSHGTPWIPAQAAGTWENKIATTQNWMQAGQDWHVAPLMAIDPAENAPLTRAQGFQVVVMPDSQPGIRVYQGQPDQRVAAAQISLVLISPRAFAHTDDQAEVGLTLKRIDGQDLPAWVRFNGETGQLLLEPPADAPSQLALRLSAQDQNGENVFTDFLITFDKNEPAPTGRMSFSDKLRQANSVTRASTALHMESILRHG
jgi:hypothetical protein